MKLIVRIILALVIAWFISLRTCASVLHGTNLFDFACGHNVFLQTVPVAILVFFIVGLLPWFRTKGPRV